jgi:transaldolase / glucose-6-phosphate isomerase
MNPLKQLGGFGQAVWLDYVSRGLIERGDLTSMVERDGLTGVTSNPSIFEKAIGHSDEYDSDLQTVLAAGDANVGTLFEHLAVGDIRKGADALRPVYDATNGADGYISLEVSPYLANDTQGTIDEARALWKTVGRPNLMIKVPGTKAGVPAIRTLIGEGMNINVTLLFSLAAYKDVAEAYIAGLEDLAKAQGPGAVSKVASVASFFVSRIDAKIDAALDAKLKDGGDPQLAELKGKVAIANAKMAYRYYQQLIKSARWLALAGNGARVQRLLWASTGTKSKAYSDVLYIKELIGRDTVNTMPPATMDAFRDHGTPRNSLEENIDAAEGVLERLKRSGISLDEVTTQLVVEGVDLFAAAADALYGAVAQQRAKFSGDKLVGVREAFGASGKAIDEALAEWTKDGKTRQLWRGEKQLWTGTDEDKWLGWLDIVSVEQADIAVVQKFAEDVRASGWRHVVLLGMGGSSLGPAVLKDTFGPQSGWPEFHMLDSTDSSQIRAVEAAIELASTLFIVSSKSGSTLEPNIFKDYFHQRVVETVGIDKAGSHFVAVTDPGSAMEKAAAAENFADTFFGLPSIGGRYSVLSKFGLVPAAALGLDVERLLTTTQRMVNSCAASVPAALNPGARLGVALGRLALDHGRDKITIVAAPAYASVGAWAEQLIAESTGKQGRGLIPVDGEALAAPEHYGQDRVFLYLGDGKTAEPSGLKALEDAGHPVARLDIADPYQVGQVFYLLEMAIAVAGAVLEINPFDQPDVEASKIKTRELTSAVEKTGALPGETPFFREDGIALYADDANVGQLGQGKTVVDYLSAHFNRVKPGDYIALLAYVERNAAHQTLLESAREHLRDAKRVATCLGFGPRFLHSTGQAYKGGPNTGVFLQITADPAEDLPVPGKKYSFGIVEAAQARADLSVLSERGRRVLRVHLADVEQGLQTLGQALEQALGIGSTGRR